MSNSSHTIRNTQRRYLAVALVTAVVALVTFATCGLMGDDEWLGGDIVCEELRSPNHENLAVLLFRGHPGTHDARYVVALCEGQGTPAMDNEAQVKYPILVCPEDAFPRIGWERNKLVISFSGRHHPGVQLNTTRWEDVEIVLNN